MSIFRFVFGWSLFIITSLSAPQLGQCQGITKFPDSFFGTSSLRTLSEYSVFQEEIDATSEQVAQASATVKEFRSKIRAIAGQARSLGNDKANRMFKEEHARQAEVAESRLRAILRPKQYLRLRQIVLQRYVKLLGVQILLSDSIVKELGLSAEELATWKQVITKQEKRQLDELKLLYEARLELEQKHLTPAQRAKFQEVYGERFAKGDRTLPPVHTNPPPEIGSHLELLVYPEIRNELEVIDEQHEKIKKLVDEIYDEHRELRALQRRHGKDKEAVKELEARVTALHDGVPKILDDILLPHQQKRLQQLLFQVVSQRQGGEPLRTPVVAEAIGMSQRQYKELIAKLDGEAKRAAKKSVDVWNDVFRTCIEALTEEQQTTYHRLVGKPFADAFVR